MSKVEWSRIFPRAWKEERRELKTPSSPGRNRPLIDRRKSIFM